VIEDEARDHLIEGESDDDCEGRNRAFKSDAGDPALEA
jgi:hypothetical protein